MPLSKEQFTQLYQKGLTTDQIVAFESGETPDSIRASQETPGFVQAVAQGIASPFLKIASTGRAIYDTANAQGTGKELDQNIDKINKKKYDYGYFGRQGSIQNPLQAAGVGAELGSYAIGGEGAVSTLVKGFKGQIIKAIMTGLGTGASSGGLASFGLALQEDNPTLLGVLVKTALGTAIGGVTGSVFGGATPVVSRALTSAPVRILANKILPQTEGRLTAVESQILKARQSIADTYKKSLPLTPTQLAKEANALEKTGDNVFTTLAKHDINLGSDDAINQLQAVSDQFDNAISYAQKNENALFNVNEVRANALKAIDDKLSSETERELARQRLNSELDSILSSNKGKVQKSATGDDLISSDIIERLRKTGNDWGQYNKLNPDSVKNATGRALASSVRDQVEKEGTFAAYREANREWGKIIHAKEILQKIEDSGKKFRDLKGILGPLTRRILSGALGLHTGGLGGFVLGELGTETAAKILSDPQLRTYLDRKLIEHLDDKMTPEVISRLTNEVREYLGNQSKLLQLPAPSSIPLGAEKIEQGSMKVVDAKRISVKNPKTGKFERGYTSEPRE